MSIFPGERCQHIKMNGDRCGASALRDRNFCRFHDSCGPVQVDVSTSATVPAAPFFLPVLEDAASIQLAITQVCAHLLHRRLDAKKAGVLLYAMQVASSNLARLDNAEDKSQHENRQKSGVDRECVAKRPLGASAWSKVEGREYDDLAEEGLAVEQSGEERRLPEPSDRAKSSV